MEQGYLSNQLPVLRRLAGCTEFELTELQQKLQPVVADWTAGLDQFSAHQLTSLQPEIHRLMILGKVPSTILKARSEMPIFISDLGRFGSLLLELLLGLGFRRFMTSDSTLRQVQAVGDAEAPASRLRQLKRSLPPQCELQLHSLLHESTARKTRLAILVEFEVCNPLEVQFWQSFDVPLLRVRFSESGTEIHYLLPSETMSDAADTTSEAAAIEAQLARAPRRMETVPAMIAAANGVLLELFRREELTQ